VGEVDQLEDAVDERVAEGDEGVDGAVREPDLEDPEEQVPVLDEVDDQPDGDKGDEREPDARDDVGRERPPTLYGDTFRLYLRGDPGLLSAGEGPIRPLSRDFLLV
jgi:hypothetical protein